MHFPFHLRANFNVFGINGATQYNGKHAELASILAFNFCPLLYTDKGFRLHFKLSNTICGDKAMQASDTEIIWVFRKKHCPRDTS